MTSPVIKSFTPLVNALECTRNYFGGGIHTYLCEFVSPPGYSGLTGPSDPKWTVDLGSFSIPFSRDISNRAVGVTLDPMSMMPGARSALLHPSSSDDFGFIPLLSIDRGRDSFVELSAATGSAAGEGNAGDSVPVGGRPKPVLDEELDSVMSGRASWLDLDVRSMDNSAPSIFTVSIVHRDTRVLALRRRIRVDTEWRRMRIPFVFPESGSAAGWRVVVRPNGLSPACAISLARIYHGNAPAASDNVRTLGSGSWDGGHLVLGDHHLWVDGQGELRIKTGVPTSDRDGYQVGSR
jgi:hypothetical protein